MRGRRGRRVWARGSAFIVCQLADYRARRGPQVAAPAAHVTTRLGVQLAAGDALKVVALSPLRRQARAADGGAAGGSGGMYECVLVQGK